VVEWDETTALMIEPKLRCLKHDMFTVLFYPFDFSYLFIHVLKIKFYQIAVI